jgi:hypothetical protein
LYKLTNDIFLAQKLQNFSSGKGTKINFFSQNLVKNHLKTTRIRFLWSTAVLACQKQSVKTPAAETVLKKINKE